MREVPINNFIGSFHHLFPRLIGSDFIIGLAKISPGSTDSNISSGPFAGGLFIARMNAGWSTHL
jgi:hypothetical protein